MSGEVRLTRRSFLGLLGGAAAAALVAPKLLARFASEEPETTATFTRMELESIQAVLKEVYGGQAIADLVYKSNPFLALVQKGRL